MNYEDGVNYKDYVIGKLKSFKKEDIVITDHARIRMLQRQIKEEEIIENLINPNKLYYAIPEDAKTSGEEKFNCYFGYSKNLCHSYVIVIKNNVVVVSVVKIQRRWQKIAEKRLRRNK